MMRAGELSFTDHARRRCQQRGIDPDVVGVLFRYGKRAYSGGAVSYAMDKVSRERARRGIGAAAYRRLEGHLDCYIIVAGDGRVVTVARRLRARGSGLGGSTTVARWGNDVCEDGFPPTRE